MSHEAIAASFDAWLEDDSTHWVGDQDAAYQAWLYVHENAVAGLEDEVSRLRAEIAGLRTGYEAFEQVNAGLKADAGRYRWLRAQQWNESSLFVVAGGRDSVRLGVDCPSADRLDAAIDAAVSGVASHG